jgi:hypothetical protein
MSKNNISKYGVPQNSRLNTRGHNVTDMTNESAFPNITNEELHISVSRYNFQPSIDESANIVNNNTTIGAA